MVHTYHYSQYENEITGLVCKPTLISKCHGVLAVNDRLIALDNEKFNSLTIDGTNYTGKNGLDPPALYAYLDKVYIERFIKTRKYQAQDVSDRYITEIIAMQMPDSAGSAPAAGNGVNTGNSNNGDNNGPVDAGISF